MSRVSRRSNHTTSSLRKDNSTYKGPETGANLVGSRKSKSAIKNEKETEEWVSKRAKSMQGPIGNPFI